MVTTMTERRRFSRQSLNEMILFRRVTGTATLAPFRAGFLRDISQGGVLFETDELLAEGDMIDVFFKERNSCADTHMRARIVRALEVGVAYEVGATFVQQ